MGESGEREQEAEAVQLRTLHASSMSAELCSVERMPYLKRQISFGDWGMPGVSNILID